MDYETTAAVLQKRIEALGPQILEVTRVFDLFKIPGFQCDDLEPSLAQAQFALSAAQKRIGSICANCGRPHYWHESNPGACESMT